MSDLVGNPEDRFSHNKAQIMSWLYTASSVTHYDNMSLYYSAIFHSCENKKIQLQKNDSFYIFAKNIDFVYTLEPPQSMF